MDARDDVFHRRAAQIPAPYRSGEKRVAGKNRRLRRFRNREADASGRVSRRVQHFDSRIAQRDNVAVMKIRIQIDDARSLRESDPVRLHFQRSVQRQIRWMQ